MKVIHFVLAMYVMCGVAFAHAKLETMSPEDGATIPEVPANVTLQFSKPIRMTSVELTHEDNQRDLDLGGQSAFATEFTAPLIDLGTGGYVVDWRGLSEDGHVMQGQFSFEVE